MNSRPDCSCSGRLRLKCDGTRSETRFRLSAKRTSPFKLARGRQFSRLPAAEVCTSAVVMLDTPCSEVVWRVLATHCIRQFPLHFPSCASPGAITFQTHSSSPHVFPTGTSVRNSTTAPPLSLSHRLSSDLLNQVLFVMPSAHIMIAKVCRGSSVGTATDWKVRGSNPGGGEVFRTRPNRSCGPPSLLYNG